MKTFNLKEKKIVFYGAASIGTLMLPVFEQAGFDVVFFIDKRANELPLFMNKKVYDVNDPYLKQLRYENYVVVVSVKNVFEHSNIAKKLVDLGFYQIIYRPLASIEGRGNDSQNLINDTYSLIEKGNFDDVQDIPCTEDTPCFIPNDDAVIEERDDLVIANIPMVLLLTDNKKRTTPWFNKPVMSLLPHIDLFRFISGDIDYSCDRYIKFCVDSAKSSQWIETTESWKQNVLRNRTEIYERMSNSVELESGFFIRNAPNVVYNSTKKGV